MAISLKAFRNNSSGKVIDAAATTAALRKNMQQYCDILIKSLRTDYDTVPEGPNYIRKYKGSGRASVNTFHPRGRRSTSQGARGVGVGGGWHSSVSGDGQTGEVWNDVPYAKYVQGHRGQQSSNNVDAGWGSIDDHADATRFFFKEKMGDAIKTGIGKARRERNKLGQFV